MLGSTASVKLAVAARDTAAAAAAAAAAVGGGSLDGSAGLDFNFLSLGPGDNGGTEGAKGGSLRHETDWIRLGGRGVQLCREVREV